MPTNARTQLAILAAGATITADQTNGPLVWVLKNGAWLEIPTGSIADAGQIMVISDDPTDPGPVDAIPKDQVSELRSDEDPWPIPPPPPPPMGTTTFKNVAIYLASQYPNGLWPRTTGVK